VKTLIVSPQAGMCNRFRALCSALLIARLSQRKVYECWSREVPVERDIDIIRQMRASSWSTFFEETPALPHLDVDESTAIDEVFSEWGPGEPWFPAQSSAIQRVRWRGPIAVERKGADALIDSRAGTVLLETSLCLKPAALAQDEFERTLHGIYRDHFRPLPVFREAAERFAPYVGVHIRRRDHLDCASRARIEARGWAKIIRREVDPAEALLLCSDDPPFAAAVAHLLPRYRTLSAPQPFAGDPRSQAFLEFLCLAGATRIYGTTGSSFSKEAALFGGRRFGLCAARSPKTLWGKMLHAFGAKATRVTCHDVPAPTRALPSR
jgi:hypothetical protein